MMLLNERFHISLSVIIQYVSRHFHHRRVFHLFQSLLIAKSTHSIGVCIVHLLLCCCYCLLRSTWNELIFGDSKVECTLLSITIKIQAPNWISPISLFPSRYILHCCIQNTKGPFMLHSTSSTFQVKNATTKKYSFLRFVFPYVSTFSSLSLWFVELIFMLSLDAFDRHFSSINVDRY